jgi:hypothetical protein
VPCGWSNSMIDLRTSWMTPEDHGFRENTGLFAKP